MATMLKFPLYYKRFGVRLPSQLAGPRVFPIEKLGLPRDAMVHFIPETKIEQGPSSDDVLFSNATRQIFIEHAVELTSRQGNPRSAYVQPGPMIQAYRRKFRRIRLMTKLEIADREPLNVLVSNYGLLPSMYKYIRSSFTSYYTWYNIQATMWNHVQEAMTQTKRQMFVTLNLPNIMPSLGALRKAEKRQTRDTLRAFQSPEALGLLDLWCWAGKERGTSLMGRISPEHMDRVNIVVRYKGHFAVVNLGVINEWRKSEEKGAVGLVPEIFQLRLLKMMTAIIESETLLDDGQMDAEIIGEEDDTDERQVELSEKEIQKQFDLLNEFTEDEQEELNQMQEEVVVLDDALDDNSQAEYQFDEEGNIIGKDENDSNNEVSFIVADDRKLESTILARADSMADKGQITAPEYRRLQALATSYQKLKDPYGSNKSLADAMVITSEDLSITSDKGIPDMPEIKDKSMFLNSVNVAEENYIENVFKKDVLAAVLSVQHAGIAVTGYEIDRHIDAVSDFEIHSVTLQPAVGRQSTIRFRLPTLKKNGQFVSNGTKYRLKKQRREIPFVKVNPTRVALTSYYSKLFVDKSDRAVFNYDRWVSNRVVADALNDSNPFIGDVLISNVENQHAKVPSIYSALSTRVAGFTIFRKVWEGMSDADKAMEVKLTNTEKLSKRVFEFDYSNRFKSGLLGKDIVEQIEKRGDLVVCGRAGDAYIVVDFNDVFYLYNHGETMVLGRIEDMLHMPTAKAPTPMAELNLFGKTLPIGVVLAYLMGLENLMKLMKVVPRRVANGERMNMSPDEFAVRFLDESLVFQKDDTLASLVFGGFNLYHRTIANYSVWSFDKKDVYLNVLDEYGIGLRYLRELDLMNAMWIDPITESLLRDMGEPTVFTNLLLRATEVLKTRYVPQKVENAAASFEGLERSAGYERFAGVVYSKLVESIRTYNTKTAISRASVSMKPHDVWMTITQDPAAELVQEINPIHNAKEKEIITYGGRGGRSQRSMMADQRLYRETDLGFISEATVDSGQVAIITYQPPNPKLTSVRGTLSSFEHGVDGPSSIFSSSALISPCADRDDPKRVNFVNIQQSHVISAEGYRATPLRTGYDQILAHRVDETFATVADKAGRVKKVDEDHMVVEYADGTSTAVQLGRRFGTAAGSTYPHDLVTQFKEGDKVAKGDVLAYNAGFFEPSPYSKNQVSWKGGVLTRTVVIETAGTLEDSSYITHGLAKKLSTEVVKEKIVIVRFDQTIRDMVRVGDKVDLDTILCTIEDAVTADNKLFDDESMSTLRLLSAMTPTAKMVGQVQKIEVFYHGDMEDMSESLQTIANTTDRDRRKEARRLGKTEVTGSVDQSMRIDGNGLDLDCMAIKFYIVSRVGTGLGDKAVFGNQMKTVVGRVIEGIHETESGQWYDAIFGCKSIQDRIVLSPILMGTTNTLLRVIGEQAALEYFGKRKSMTL